MHYRLSWSASDSTEVLHTPEETRFTANADCDDAVYSVSAEAELLPEDGYVLLPACAYDGNRFEAVHRHYPPFYLASEMGTDVPLRMTEVPRLSRTGDSRMEVTTGDLSVPCVGIFDRRDRTGFLLFTCQGAHDRNFGITLEQKGALLRITLRAPVLRSRTYRNFDGYPSCLPRPDEDRAMAVRAGDVTVIPHRIFEFPCESVPELYRVFFEQRDSLYSGHASLCLPFSAYADMTETRNNELHYEPEKKYYALTALGDEPTHWMPGWCGGGMTTFGLCALGSDETRTRATDSLLWASRYQSGAGFFYGNIRNDGTVVHDDFGQYPERPVLLIRKHTDYVYFLCKHLLLLRSRSASLPAELLDRTHRGCDAISKLYETYGQLGQFIDADTGEILCGGTASGSTAPAALAAASALFGDDAYLGTAKAIAEQYYREATLPGVTAGGPGEILSAPDSESSAGLFESYMLLFDMTGEARFLAYAKDAAHQLASWVVPYDYEFPKTSRFGKLGVRTTGSVFANVQNKHSAPGLCTLSPSAYLRLYRATGDERYLRIMREISRFMPQTVSRPDRPVDTFRGTTMRPGEMCERVNMSDWEGYEHVGDFIFGACCWPEASLLLTCAEIPGIYLIPERGICCVSDHVDASFGDGILTISNPTVYAADVRVFTETDETLASPLSLSYFEDFRTVRVEAGGTRRIPLEDLCAAD